MASQDTNSKFLVLLLVPILLFLVIYGIKKVNNYSRLKKTEGVVFAIGTYKMPNLRHRYPRQVDHDYPVIQYFVDGKEYFHMKKSEFLFQKYKEGDKVNILYNPQDPHQAFVNSLFGYWMTIPYIIIFLVLSLFWIGLIYILADSRILK